MNQTENLKVGLIGLGKMGQNHLRVLSMLKMVDLEFIFDISKETTKIYSDKYGVKVSNNLIDDLQNVDAVVIATPTFTHYDYIKLASDYVKNIFVEKPLTDKLNTSQEVEIIAEKKGLNIQVGFIERFNPAVIELRKILKNNDKVVNIDFTRTNKLSNRIKDVDVILDLMIHDIDLALYLNGTVKDLYAYGTLQEGMISFASAILQHQNERFSRITASRITEKRIRQISVTSHDFFIDCNLLKKEILLNKQTVPQSYEYFSLASVEETVNVSTQEALLSEMIAFTKSSLKSDTFDGIIPNIRSAIDAMKIANEIQESIWGGL